jgi:2,3,4,5-tetrahydropyridine-2-carboxylate N-succinyltransferase
VYDCVHHNKLEKGAPVPENAVVIPGSRPVQGDWAEEQGLNMHCPLIVKYRDARSDASLELEEVLR